MLAKEIVAVTGDGTPQVGRGVRRGMERGYHHPVARRARKLPRRRRRPRSVRYLDLFHAITAIRGRFNNRSLIVTPARPALVPSFETSNPPTPSFGEDAAASAILSGTNDSGVVFRRFRVCRLWLAEIDCLLRL